MKKNEKQRGLTLVELMVVIVIIGLISGIVVFNVLPAADKAAVSTARTDIKRLQTALTQYRLDNQSYPTQAQGLEALVEMPRGLRRPERYQTGGYIQSLPEDPWGNPYVYIYPGEFGEFDIVSYGRDGRPGGEGLDADIGSWEN
ncbi:type II secretion system major pseudopilin GspG [Parvularcula lutaonensis]|uniref:Type II secretion system core protein G n=1 Tax=Parvularcula lutaonensis TaxID=491923 RepID=A0ABV7MF74_9PROT|nr:type II secretion system major pseudopilin GspG [Parvularcula lutaonensis]GGY52705.1 type II secretion system protein GspG [Parvularcula lutaonensis]